MVVGGNHKSAACLQAFHKVFCPVRVKKKPPRRSGLQSRFWRHFPEDLHKPDITYQSQKVEKAVIKFMIEEGE